MSLQVVFVSGSRVTVTDGKHPLYGQTGTVTGVSGATHTVAFDSGSTAKLSAKQLAYGVAPSPLPPPIVVSGQVPSQVQASATVLNDNELLRLIDSRIVGHFTGYLTASQVQALLPLRVNTGGVPLMPADSPVAVGQALVVVDTDPQTLGWGDVVTGLNPAGSFTWTGSHDFSASTVVLPATWTWDASGFSGVLAPTDTTLQAVFDKLDAVISDAGGDLSANDINTLAKLNAIITDANLVDAAHTHAAASITGLGSAAFSSNTAFAASVHTHSTDDITGLGSAALVSTSAFAAAAHTHPAGDITGLGTAALASTTAFATAAQGTKADTAIQPGANISTLTNDAGYLTAVPASLTWSAAGFSSNLAGTDDTLQEVFNKLDALPLGGDFSAADINTLAKLNAIVSDATLVDANHNHTLAQITDAGTAAAAATTDFATAAQGATADSAVQPGDLATVATSGSYTDLLDKPDLTALNEISVHANQAAFPATGTSDRVYIAEDTGYMYRWNGVSYTQLTDQTAIWGQITGTLSNQSDLVTNLNSRDTANRNVDNHTSGTTNKVFTAANQTKLAGIATGAEVNVNADWNAASGDAQILNKPVLGTAAAASTTDFATAAQGTKADTAIQPGANVSTLTNDAGYLTVVPSYLTWSAASFAGNLAPTDDTLQEIFNKFDALTAGGGSLNSSDINTLAKLNAIVADATLVDANHNHTLAQITDAGTAAAAATTDFATAAQGVKADSAVQPGDLATVATTGGYSDLIGKPTLGSAAAAATTDFATAAQGLTADSAVQPGDLSTVATTGSYNDLLNKPDLTALNELSIHANQAAFPGTGTSDHVYLAEDTGYMYRWNGSGYTQLTDQTAIWGQITGTLTNQTDLVTNLNSRDTANRNTDNHTSGTTNKVFTAAEQTKLAGIATGAEVNVNADWNAVSGDAQILNKPTLGTAAAASTSDFATAAQGTLADSATQPGDNVSTLTNDSGYLTAVPAYLTWSAAGFAGNLASTDDTLQEVFNKFDALTAGGGSLNSSDINTLAKLNAIVTDATLVDANHNHTLAQITDAGTAAAAATTDFATAAQGVTADSAVQPGDLATVATTGDYNDLLNKPDLSALNEISAHVNQAAFPATGTTDVVYIAEDTGYLYRWNGSSYTQLTDQTAIWGQITGTLSNQTDLTAELGSRDTANRNVDNHTSGTANKVFTVAEQTKLAGIATGAEVNVNADWNAGSGDAQILNKPVLGTAAAAATTDFATAVQGTTADTAVQPGDLATVATTGSYNDLLNKPTATAAGSMTVINHEANGSYYYYGGTMPDSSWKINRFTTANGTKTTATIANNGGTPDYATAWTNRLTLAYA